MLKFVTAKKHTSSIIEVPIPDGVWSHICQYVPGAKDLEDPPHITLLTMPSLGKDKLEQVQEALKTLCSQWAPFQVTITGSGKFPSDKDKVPHFAKISAPQLVEFRDCLAECLQDIDPDLIDMESFPNFTPHLTVQYVPKEEKLPVIKPIAFTLRGISLSFKGTAKSIYPLSLAADMQGVPSTPTPSAGETATVDIITTANLKQLATNISTRLASLGYESEALKIAETAEVLGKKKKHKKDTSVQKFQKKLRDQLKQYVPYHHMDIATHSIMNLLMDDMGHDAPGDHRDDEGLFGGDGDSDDSPGDSGSGADTGGGEAGGEGGGGEGGGGATGEAVKALGPHMEGVDPHIMTRMKGMQSVVEPTANKATPFMERNYSAELRTWLRRNTSNE